MGMKIPITFECDGLFCEKIEIAEQDLSFVDDDVTLMKIVTLKPPSGWAFLRFGDGIVCESCRRADRYKNDCW